MPLIASIRCPRRPPWRTGFTLVELLVVVAIVALLIAVLLPSLSSAMAESRRVQCASNLRQLGQAMLLYSHEHRGKAMPFAYVENTPHPTYWYGREYPDRVDPTQGFVWPYLHSDLSTRSVFECPEQPRGSYEYEQGGAGGNTSTYGYNAYFLCPPRSSGWKYTIGQFPWQSLDSMPDAARVLTFADTMIVWGSGLKNSALLDPPWLYLGYGNWSQNSSPTTAFRHRAVCNGLLADGHVSPFRPAGATVWNDPPIGSVSETNDPFYVPTWREWR